MVLSFGYDVWEREGWRVQKYVCKNTGYRNKFFEKNWKIFLIWTGTGNLDFLNVITGITVI